MSTDIANLQSAFYDVNGETLSIYISVANKLVMEMSSADDGVLYRFTVDRDTVEDFIAALIVAATVAQIPLVNVGFK